MRRVSGRVVIGSPVLPLKSRCSAAGAPALVDTCIPIQNELDVSISVCLLAPVWRHCMYLRLAL